MSELLVTYNKDQRGVVHITLNRPAKHNAFDEQVIALLTQAFEQANADPLARVVILQANGKHFSAGADLQWMKKMVSYDYERNHQDACALATMLNRLYTLNKPTIAKVSGAAYGGAVGLIACCDMAVATKLSKFCLSEVKLGLTPATIAPYVINAIGPRQARRYMQTAEIMTARRARRIGLLSEAVSEDDIDNTVDELIEHCLNAGPQALAMTKQLIDWCQFQPITSELMHKTAATIASIRVSPEGQEGLGAFFDKRPAQWHKDNHS